MTPARRALSHDGARDVRPATGWLFADPPSYSHRTVTGGDVYRALWRHKWFILVLTAACVGAAWFATVQQTDSYEASTLVRVQERGRLAGNASQALQASQDLAQTYAKMIGSGVLAGEIRTLVATCTRSKTSTAKSPSPQRPASPRSATQGIAGTAGASSCAWLVGKRRAGLAPGAISRVKLSAAQVQDLDLLSITARNTNPMNALIAAAAAPDALRAFIRKTAPASERIVTVNAAAASSLVSRHLALNVAIALMLGLIFSGALALLIELFRDRLPEADELEQAVGYPVLATIPALRLHEVLSASAGRAPPAGTEGSVDGESAQRAGSSRGAPER
jgi:capsular polysaccharide biosynthesis protein